MFFNSYEFVLYFLPLTITSYFLMGHFKKVRLSNLILLIASLFFYYQFNWMFIPMILVSIAMNYEISVLLQKKKSKALLVLGIILNLLCLIYFKYTNFFIENLNLVLQSDFTLVNLIIPIGISFFTFQQLSFIVDTYKNPKINYPFLEYALHILLFLYIISGPIVRHNQIIPQLQDSEKKRFNAENFAKGSIAFSIGLAKKVLIADTFAVAANWGFDNVQSLNTTSALFVMLAFTLQIYFDFSGYSDMVTGIGSMLNISIPMNFNSPYKALDITDFWKRWHITLTRFFTDYIYIPLGGNRKGVIVTYLNIFIVFFVSGLWHGANWTFIIWGCLHGVYSILNRVFRKEIKRVNPVLSWAVTFFLVNVAWVFFRANGVGDAIHLLKVIASFQFGSLPYSFTYPFVLSEFTFLIELFHISSPFIPGMITALFFIGSLVCILQGKNTNERISEFKPSLKYGCVIILVLAWSIISFSNVTSFIYVNF